jgi:hypothetical protein
MKRFSLLTCTEPGRTNLNPHPPFRLMVETPEGKWVKYGEVVGILGTIKRFLADAKTNEEDWRSLERVMEGITT